MLSTERQNLSVAPDLVRDSSMLNYKDFVPKEISASGFLRPGEYEDFDQAVMAANDWLKEADVKLLKIETVVLPNIHSRWEEGTGDAAIRTSGDSPSQWHQFLRCWYYESNTDPEEANAK